MSFDRDGFAAAVAAIITARGITDRQAAREAGLAPSTITRCVRGPHRPDVDSLAALADWAGLPVDAFIVRRRPIPDAPTVIDTRRVTAAQQATAGAAETLALLLAGDGTSREDGLP